MLYACSSIYISSILISSLYVCSTLISSVHILHAFSSACVCVSAGWRPAHTAHAFLTAPFSATIIFVWILCMHHRSSLCSSYKVHAREVLDYLSPLSPQYDPDHRGHPLPAVSPVLLHTCVHTDKKAQGVAITALPLIFAVAQA